MKTGWPPGLLQDDDRKLSRWFAGKPDARYQLRKSMTEEEADKAHEVWEMLWSLLRETAYKAMNKHSLNKTQREYIENKLNEDMRYWE
jgi:hypothetical protein